MAATANFSNDDSGMSDPRLRQMSPKLRAVSLTIFLHVPWVHVYGQVRVLSLHISGLEFSFLETSALIATPPDVNLA